MVDPLSRRITPSVMPVDEALAPVVRPSTPAVPSATDHLAASGAPVMPRAHRVDDTSTPATLYESLRDSPTTRAVIMGAGGLASLIGGTQAAHAEVRVAAPVAQQAPKTIIYVGMNAEASHEVDALKGRVGANGVTFLQPSKVQGQITHAGQTYDLNTDEGRVDFGRAIGLPTDKANALAEILKGTDADARDEAGQLARVFREADRGTRQLERIVLSGHSVGSGVWGDGNGYLKLSVIGQLSMLFPRAGGQVQDLMMAACYSGGESKLDTYTAMFPNLRSVWAYDGSAPGAVSGAVPHILRWERGTRADAGDNLSRSVATGTRKGENVAVWTAVKGYDNGEARGPIEQDRTRYESSHEVLANFVSGETAVENAQTGPLRNHYNSIQRMLSRPDLPATERTELEGERDLVIRLLYWKNVGTMFQQTYATDVSSAFGEMGLAAPNFGTLSRKDALARITELDAKIASTPSASASTRAFATRLHDALVKLSSDAVPAAWL